MFDVSHMGEIETSGPQAEELLQRLLSNDVTKIAERGAQYSVLCREDGGVLDDLFTYRLGAGPLPDRHERVEPREGPRLVPRARGRFRRRGRGRPRALGDARRAGTRRPRGGGARGRGRAAGADADGGRGHRGSRVPRLRHGLHRRGRRGAADPAGRRRRRSGTRCCEQGVVPAGLGARDTLRLEVCFHLYGNDLSEDRNPIEAGLGVVLQARHRLHRRGRAARHRAGADARAVRLHGRRHPAPGQPGAHASTATES